MTFSGQRVFGREMGMAQNIGKWCCLSSPFGTEIESCGRRTAKKKKCLQFFKCFATWLCQPLRDGIFSPTSWIWAVLWLDLAARMGQKRRHVSSKPKISHTSSFSPILLPSLWEQHWTSLLGDETTWGAELHHPSWGHPRSTISNRFSSWWQTPEQTQLTSYEPISDQSSCSASPERHEKRQMVVILSH